MRKSLCILLLVSGCLSFLTIYIIINVTKDYTRSVMPLIKLEPIPFAHIHEHEIQLPLKVNIRHESEHLFPSSLYNYNSFKSKFISDVHYNIPHPKVTHISCDLLFLGNSIETQRAISYQETNDKVPIPDRAYIHKAANCQHFKKERQYMTSSITEEEAGFPIAYSILLFKDVEQFERLLRAIYRPHNYYCIHVDKKSSAVVHEAIEAIVNCFENVFVASQEIDVSWGTFSVLEPDLVCMQDLLKYKKWKYFINLTGQEFPLKTNLDLVKILKALNGSVAMEGTEKRRNKERTANKEPFPHDISLMKGSVHIAVPRAFVEFIITSEIAISFKEWLKDTYVPDETFFSSLGHSPQLGVPGAIIGLKETHLDSYPFITRFKNWGDGPFDWPCHGQRVRMVCIFGVGDLPFLATRMEMFANKFYLDYHPIVYDCMEELYYEKMKFEMSNVLKFDDSYYRNLSFVKNHNLMK